MLNTVIVTALCGWVKYGPTGWHKWMINHNQNAGQGTNRQ
jgi:hypothetical protein